MKEILGKYGNVTDFNFKCKGHSNNLGYAFIGFEGIDSGSKAIEGMNGMNLMNQKLILSEAVGIFNPERPKSSTNKSHKQKVYKDKVEQANLVFFFSIL